MFGKNPQRQIAISDGAGLFIHEVFHTIQGEGPFSGMPAVFIRLAGCNLACTWCDTEFESSFKLPNGGLQQTAAVVAQVAAMMKANRGTRLVVITGGEPMRQNIVPLIDGLLALGGEYSVQIETAGTIPPQAQVSMQAIRDRRLTFVVSPKTARINTWYVNLYEHLGMGVHLKYVIAAGDSHPDDGLPFLPTQKEDVGDRAKYLAHPAIYRPSYYMPGVPIWVSPCDDHDTDNNAMNVVIAVESCLKYGYRLSLQVHKLVGVS